MDKAVTLPLPYTARSAFIPFHERKQRFSCLVTHRRAGKTHAACQDLVLRAAQVPWRGLVNFAFIAPFYGQAKRTAWRYLKEFSRPFLVGVPNETELRLDLASGARIYCFGIENADALRGMGLAGVILDEFGDFPPRAWPSVIRPMLSDTRGWATFLGTPRGRNEFFDIYETAMATPDRWYCRLLRASESGLIEADELEDLRLGLTTAEFNQEYECDFTSPLVGAYYGDELIAAERAGHITSVPIEPGFPVHCSWDLGYADCTSIWAFQVLAGELRIVGCYENHGQNLAHYVAELRSRGWIGGSDWVPHDARVHSLDTGRTRVETLVNLGRIPCLVPGHTVADGMQFGENRLSSLSSNRQTPLRTNT